MSISIKPISIEEFEKTQHIYACANFQQSAQMAKCQKSRAVYIGTELIQILDDGRLIGQSIINYRKFYKFFKRAYILNGPLMDYTDSQKVSDVFIELEKYLKGKCDEVKITPPLHNLILNDKLEISARLNERVGTALCELGFSNFVDRSCSQSIDQIFIKNLSDYESFDKITKEWTSAFRSSIKKFSDSCVKLRELKQDEIDVFYNIYTETGKRKNFVLQSKEYFRLLKENFGEQAKFMEAYLDCRAYEKYLSSNITNFEQKVSELEKLELTKKVKGQLNDAKDQLRSYLKRKESYDKLQIDDATISLSSYVFICYGDEVIILYGGSHADYLNFGGSTLLNYAMIRHALESGYKRYNFYGTIETDQLTKAKGNYHFKKNFGGNLVVLIGTFTKTFNPFVTMLKRIKKHADA